MTMTPDLRDFEHGVTASAKHDGSSHPTEIFTHTIGSRVYEIAVMSKGYSVNGCKHLVYERG